MMTLHEIANDYIKAFESDDTETLTTALDSIKGSLEVKATNVAKYINGLTAAQKAIDDEIARLETAKRVIANKEKNLRDYLEHNMKKCGITKIESPLFKIQFQKCPCKVDVINDNDIPDEYKKVKTEVVIDKNKIKAEIKAGVVIPGVALIQSEKLVIK